MDILSKGRDKLRAKGIAVASDLTERQNSIVQGYRRDGIHAYYIGSRLVSDNRFEPLAGNDWHEEDKDDDGDDDDISVTVRSEWPGVEESFGVYVASSG
nr:hypothetical protein BaRGS_033016 [Batillaria attramentaria]